MDDPQIAFPDRRDPVEDRGEQNALGKNAGSEKILVIDCADVHAPNAAHHIFENHKPENRLNGTHQQFKWIVLEFYELCIRYGERVRYEFNKRRLDTAFRYVFEYFCACVGLHDSYLRIRFPFRSD